MLLITPPILITLLPRSAQILKEAFDMWLRVLVEIVAALSLASRHNIVSLRIRFLITVARKLPVQ